MRKWYAIYTKHHHENKVALQLNARSIENYLPISTSLRKWKDRKVWLELPVFPCYLFIQCEITEQLHKLRRMRGVISIVGHPMPESVPDYQIESIRKILSFDVDWEHFTGFCEGEEVLIVKGLNSSIFEHVIIPPQSKTQFIL